MLDEFPLRNKIQSMESLSRRAMSTYKYNRLYSVLTNVQPLQELCDVVSTMVGGLDDLESSLNRFQDSLTPTLVTQVLNCCKDEASSRRLLRFFSWSRKILNSNVADKDFNYAIRILAEKKDHTAMQVLISDLRAENRTLDSQTYGIVAEALVKLGKEDEALGIFKSLEKFKCPHDSVTVAAIVSSLCSKGHAKKAEGVVLNHKDKIQGVEQCVYRSLLHGWSVQENVKEARRIMREMRSLGFMPDIFCFNTFLRCLCKRNLKKNPSGLMPEALNLFIEMRTHNVAPTTITYNILLSCLGRTRRVKESCRVLHMMKKWGCPPDWVSYYLVVRVLYLSGRFGKGNEMMDEMMKHGLVPERKLYYSLVGVLCGVDRVNHALDLFERMKRSELGEYGPVYDVLIPKLCSGGEFVKAKELWEEAIGDGIGLSCSVDVLDPCVTQVFRPLTSRVEMEEVSVKILEFREEKSREQQHRIRRKKKGGTRSGRRFRRK